MQYRSLKPGSTSQNGTPFICQSMPFVWFNDPLSFPFICGKLPLVCNKPFGFTLVELIITLTIIGILTALAAPGMGNFIKNQRLSSQTNDLVSDLNFARSEAIKRATSITICKSNNPSSSTPACNPTVADAWTSGRIIFVDFDGDGAIDTTAPVDVVLRVRDQLDGATTGNRLRGEGDATQTANRIIYTGAGITTLPAGEWQLSLCDNRGSANGRAIVVHAMGRSRISATNKDNTTLTCP